MRTWTTTIILSLWLLSCGSSSNGTTDAGGDAGHDAGHDAGNQTDEGPDLLTNERWASSHNLGVAINSIDQPAEVLTEGLYDFKPSWSMTGGMLTFFRLVEYHPAMSDWKTRIGVINIDGSGVQLLTSGEWADFNQTFTRDGSNLIVFNRSRARGPISNDIYQIAPDGSPGEEVLLSNPDYDFEWVFSGLQDGRLLIERIDWPGGIINMTFLLTPNPGGVGTYEEIQRPTTKVWHKLSLSPSETKVTYMLDEDNNFATYKDVVLHIADFDKTNLTISNQVAIADADPAYIDEYPRWNSDGSLVIYDSNRTGKYQMYAYRLADGETFLISSDPESDSQFGNFEGCPK